MPTSSELRERQKDAFRPRHVDGVAEDAITEVERLERELAGASALWDRLCSEHHSAVCEGGMVDGSDGCPYCHVEALQGEVADAEAERDAATARADRLAGVAVGFLRRGVSGVMYGWSDAARALGYWLDGVYAGLTYESVLEAALSADAGESRPEDAPEPPEGGGAP